MKAPGGRGGERRYSSYSCLISALDGGEWSASRPGRALPPGNEPPVLIGQEALWAPELVWTQRLEEKSFPSVGDRTPVVQSVTILTELLRLLTVSVNIRNILLNTTRMEVFSHNITVSQDICLLNRI
jgi:hypothetical protein